MWEDARLSGEARYIALSLVACRVPFLMSECTEECGKIGAFIFIESASGLVCHLPVQHNSVFMQVKCLESFLLLKLHMEALTQITFQTSTWPIHMFSKGFPTFLFFEMIVRLRGHKRQDSLPPTPKAFLF